MLAPFFAGGCRARCALTVVAVQKMGMWVADGNGRIDCGVA